MTDRGDPKQAPPKAASRLPGLSIRRGAAKYARPASGFTGTARPVAIAAPTGLETLKIDSHRALAAKQRDIAARVEAHPELSVMLLINPALAFKQLGVEMSPEITDHVLHAIQHPTAVRGRREELEASLAKTLGEPAQPTDPCWNAHLLFDLRKLAPLEIGDAKPVYGPPLGQPEAESLHALRPVGRVKYPQPRLLAPRSRVNSAEWKESLRRMDLNAPAPKLPQAPCKPKEVPLEDLWFYKDLDPVVRDALELGMILRSAYPIHSPDSYRQIAAGDKPNAFRSWIKQVRFNPK